MCAFIRMTQFLLLLLLTHYNCKAFVTVNPLISFKQQQQETQQQQGYLTNNEFQNVQQQQQRQAFGVLLHAKKGKRRRRRKDGKNLPSAAVTKNDDDDAPQQAQVVPPPKEEKEMIVMPSSSNDLPDFDDSAFAEPQEQQQFKFRNDQDDFNREKYIKELEKLDPEKVKQALEQSRREFNNPSSDMPDRSLEYLIVNDIKQDLPRFEDQIFDEDDDGDDEEAARDAAAVVAKSTMSKKKAKRLARQAEREAEQRERESIQGRLKEATKDLTPLMVIEKITWAGIYLLIGWEIYINSPFFDRAAPLAPVVYQ